MINIIILLGDTLPAMKTVIKRHTPEGLFERSDDQHGVAVNAIKSERLIGVGEEVEDCHEEGTQAEVHWPTENHDPVVSLRGQRLMRCLRVQSL